MAKSSKIGNSKLNPRNKLEAYSYTITVQAKLLHVFAVVGAVESFEKQCDVMITYLLQAKKIAKNDKS